MMRKAAAFMASLCLCVCGLADAYPHVHALEDGQASVSGSYWEYIDRYKAYPVGKESLPVDLTAAVVQAGNASWREEEQAWETDEKSEMAFSLEVSEAGLYQLRVDYMSCETSGTEILRTVLINGEMPFEEARGMLLRRLYTDGERGEDALGNQIRPTQIEVPKRQQVLLRDYMGYITEPLSFYLNKGKNTITLSADSAPCLLYGLSAVPVEPEPSFSKNAAGTVTEAEPITVQGEDATLKTSPMLYPDCDRVTADTTPSSPSVHLLNIIGGDNWSEPNQAILWDFDVETAGYYTLTLKVRQSITRGLISTRDIYLDGEMPYTGMKNWKIGFRDDWQYITLQDESGEPLRFYLDAGSHQLEMVAVLGEKAERIRIVNEQLEQLNDLYTRIMIVTGPSPDMYRDYKLENLVPDELTRIPKIAEALREVRDWYLSYYEVNTQNNAILDTLIRQLDKFDRDAEMIAKEFTSFKSNIASLAEWVVEARKQPLEVDYFTFVPVGGQFVPEKASLWERFVFGLTRFICSFQADYNLVGAAGDKDAITVWIPTGRDQAQVLKKLIDSSFTPQHNIAVDLKLVAAGTLLPATVAGSGPDIALNNGDADAVNYGMRNAVKDLAAFSDFESVQERFLPQRMTPFYYNGKCYALPETQSFAVMFYRKDILDALGLSVPKTWTELTSAVAVLLKNNMGFAMPVNASAYYWLLYQEGGSLYNERGTKTVIDSDVGVESFRFWTSLYKNYELPVTYNFLARFRTGEYPLIIEEFTNANTLSISAPEIRGLWGFAPVPGRETEDGALDNTVTLGGLCSLMLENTDQPQESWEFMKWWTESDTQTAYGREMETILGASARYNSANIESFNSTAWSTEQKDVLKEQLQSSRGIPQIPGGYFMDRHLTNAFRKVIYQNGDPQDVLYDYVYTINQEITGKRQEFGLEVE